MAEVSEAERIQELEAEVAELHKLLWMHVEVMAKSSALIAELSAHRKPGTTGETDSEHLDLLVRSRAALLICESWLSPKATILNLDTLLDDLKKSIDRWMVRAG